MSRNVRTLQRVQQILCGLRGHDAVLYFEPRRVSLRCLSCGHQTAGWSLDREHPPVNTAGDTAARHSWAGHIGDVTLRLASATLAHIGGSHHLTKSA